MTKLLDQAIEQFRKLPDADQNDAAEMILWAVEIHGGALPLDFDTSAAIDEGLAQAKRGEFATEAEVAALWKRHGL
jgi:hypothetical protein